MLLVIVFAAGAVLMALEIVGSRVVAPQFGSSIFVWGSLISVFLTGLSTGYYLGGRLADRWPSHRLLACLFLPPAAWILATPLLARPLGDLVLAFDVGEKWGPLAITTILFLVPSAWLGLISPFAIRLAARSVSTVGHTAGLLYAVSTAGSIVGTLGAAFFLIPSFGTRAILYGLGLSLVGLAALTALAAALEARAPDRAAARSKATAAALAGLLVGLVAPPAAAQERIVFEKDSAYHHIIVFEDGDSRILRFNQARQSGMYLSDPYRLRFLYTEYASLPLVLKPDTKAVAFIGLGGGSLPKKYRRDYPHMRIDVSEIDPEVVEVAKRFFGFREDPLMRVTVADGRNFLRKKGGAGYGYVFVDAYNSDSIPFQLTTVEFLNEQVKPALAPDGVVAWNVIGSLTGPRSKLFRSMYKTFRAAFPQVYVFPVGGAGYFEGGALGNILLVGAQSMARVSREAFVERARTLEANGTVKEAVGRHALAYHAGPIPTDDVKVLTDDHAPVDSLMYF